ncbi:MAG: hypothetical protein WBE71_10165, partial [Xanthobacteraceae bacterium]
MLAEAVSGPANLRLGFERSFASVIEAAAQCLREALLGERHVARGNRQSPAKRTFDCDQIAMR